MQNLAVDFDRAKGGLILAKAKPATDPDLLGCDLPA